jgi:hypothetical protein
MSTPKVVDASKPEQAQQIAVAKAWTNGHRSATNFYSRELSTAKRGYFCLGMAAGAILTMVAVVITAM